MDKDCRNCQHAKDRYKDACYCTYYGYMRARPKKDCCGWNQNVEKPVKAKKEDKHE